MQTLALGEIEVVGFAAAVEAADVAVKTANVELLGYELANGAGMVSIKVQGQVGAVRAAMSAAKEAAAKVNKVVSVQIIARPSDQIDPMVLSPDTVGLDYPGDEQPEPVPEPAPVGPSDQPAAASEPAEPEKTQSDKDEPAAEAVAAAPEAAKQAEKPVRPARPARPAKASSAEQVQSAAETLIPEPASPQRRRKAPATPEQSAEPAQADQPASEQPASSSSARTPKNTVRTPRTRSGK